jgi:rhodanese-related sulfurtransferase
MVEELAPEEVAAKIRQDPTAVVLLDVREPFEREIARIEPSVHIPMAEVPTRAEELPRDREIIVYCHGGTRSAMVAGFLEAKGYARVANLSGGIDAWSVRVDRRVPRYS